MFIFRLRHGMVESLQAHPVAFGNGVSRTNCVMDS